MEEKCFFVVPAGGCGTRFGAPLPKQFVRFLGKPLIVYTLEALLPYSELSIVALPKQFHPMWKSFCREYPQIADCKVVEGGDTRFESVKKALKQVPSGVLVGIHDAVRPMISGATIQRLITTARQRGNAVPIQYLTDSLRRLIPPLEKGSCRSHSVDRSLFVTVQTPQIFQSDQIKAAYEKDFQPSFTDDCSVFEAAFGKSPTLVQDTLPNLKITRPEDSFIFEAFLKGYRG